jgi:hypothetical protein
MSMALDMAAVDVRADSTSPAQAAVAALLGSALVGSVCVAWNRATPIIPSGQEGIPTTSVARVVELWVYPVKGMKGIQLQEAALRRGPAGGFLWDRRFMVVDAGGNCVTQRELPALATVTTALNFLHTRTHVLRNAHSSALSWAQPLIPKDARAWHTHSPALRCWT